MTELEILRAQVEVLREAHTLANGALRSAWQVAERDGRETNWSGFRTSLRASLDASHAAINCLASIPNAIPGGDEDDLDDIRKLASSDVMPLAPTEFVGWVNQVRTAIPHLADTIARLRAENEQLKAAGTRADGIEAAAKITWAFIYPTNVAAELTGQNRVAIEIYHAIRALSPPSPKPVVGAIAEIAAERQRQIDAEGWTLTHDDEHVDGQMALAAAAYAYGAATYDDQDRRAGHRPAFWPWDASWWKPKSDRFDLIRAGALIVAEIERLDREAARFNKDLRP